MVIKKQKSIKMTKSCDIIISCRNKKRILLLTKLDWLGFYNVSTQQREWEECQFNRENEKTPVILTRL